MIERYIDGVKTAGAANSGGFFGAGVALYYFGSKSADIAFLLKTSSFVYFAGIWAFGFAYLTLMLFIEQQYTAHSQRYVFWTKLKGYPSLLVATLLTIAATVLWFTGSILAGIALYKLQFNSPVEIFL